MIKNSIIFYYKNDVVLGDYFFNSANFAITLLNQVDVKQSHVIDNNCNFANANNIFKQLFIRINSPLKIQHIG